MSGEPSNGYVRWRDINALEGRLREEHDADLERLEGSVKERLDKAHDYHTGLAGVQTDAIDALIEWRREVDSVLNQQRGARNLAYALIGTNLLAVAAILYHLFVR